MNNMDFLELVLPIYRWIPLGVSIAAFIYSISIVGLRSTTYESDGFISSVVTLTKGFIFIPIAWFFQNHPALKYREIAMGVLILVEFITLIDIYHENVAGRRFRNVDLSGKVYIVTGSNTGLGFETALALVRMNATVILACRAMDKANAARDSILKSTECSPSKVIVLKLDLCDFNSVHKFVEDFIKLGLPLHCLINNAGLMMSQRNEAKEGLEMVFTANHLSHFLLTNLLLPEIEKTNGRIVNLSSALHHSTTQFNFDDVMSEKYYSLFYTYSQSKLANILFTLELSDRLRAKNSKVTCNAVHPGIVRTEVTRHMHPIVVFLNSLVAPIMLVLQKTPEQGAFCSVYAATEPTLASTTGKYFVNSIISQMSKGAMDVEARKRLWEISEKLTGFKEK